MKIVLPSGPAFWLNKWVKDGQQWQRFWSTRLLALLLPELLSLGHWTVDLFARNDIDIYIYMTIHVDAKTSGMVWMERSTGSTGLHGQNGSEFFGDADDDDHYYYLWFLISRVHISWLRLVVDFVVRRARLFFHGASQRWLRYQVHISALCCAKPIAPQNPTSIGLALSSFDKSMNVSMPFGSE